MVEKKKKTAAATAKHHFSARDPTYELGAQDHPPSSVGMTFV